MDRPELLTWVMLGFVVLIALGVVGWIARRRSQKDIPRPLGVPDDIGEVIEDFDGLYVSTTSEGRPLNRIAVRGLGFRGRVALRVATNGLVVAIAGVDEFFIPASAIRDVHDARYTIDRVVEEGGLAVISWMLGDVPLDSYFRLTDNRRFIAAAGSLIVSPPIQGEKAL